MTDSSAGGVRIDKWLQVARAFKTRAQATRACALGRVRVNGERVKPHRQLRIGDQVEIEVGDWKRILLVQVLRDRTVPRAEAKLLYEDRSPPRPERDPIERAAAARHALRERGSGRPTKRDRRRIERLRENEG